MTLSRLSFSLLLLAPFCLASCSETPKPTEPEVPVAAVAINKICPIMAGGEVVEGGGETTWKGMKVGFCCPSCVEEFEKLSDADKVAALTKNNPGWTLPEGVTLDPAPPADAPADPVTTPEPAPAPTTDDIPAPPAETTPEPAPVVDPTPTTEPAPAPTTDPAPAADAPATDAAATEK